jgi:hypothetical protein
LDGVVAFATLGLLLTEPGVIEEFERLIGGGLVVARVVRQAGDRRKRELVVGDPVLAAQFERVHAQLGCQLVHHPLDGERGLRAARTPVRVGPRGVGEDACALEPVRGELVDPAVHERSEQWYARRDQPQVGAHVGEQAHIEASDCAVAARAEAQVLDLVAAVVRGEHAVAARLGVLDRLAHLLRGHEGDQLLGRHLQLAAEAPADVGRDHPDLVLRYAELQRQEHAQDVRDLRRRPHRDLVCGRIHDHAAWLDRRRDEPLLHEPAFDHHVGGVQRRADLLAGARVGRVEDPGVALVGAVIGMDQVRAVRQRLLHVEDDGERLVVDLDRLQRVDGAGPVASDHDGDRLARMPHLGDGQRRVVRVHDVVGHGPCQRQAALELGHVRAGHRADDVRHGERVRHVDAGDARVRHRAAQDRQVQHPGQRDVLGPHRPAGDQPGVLLARSRLPELAGRGVFLRDGHVLTSYGIGLGTISSGTSSGTFAASSGTAAASSATVTGSAGISVGAPRCMASAAASAARTMF